MALINFTDKVALNDNPNVPDINKVKDSDLNIIKQVGNQILTTLGLYTDNWIVGDDLHEDEYAAGDIVVYDNRLFENLTGNNTTTTPDQDTTNWQEIYILVN